MTFWKKAELFPPVLVRLLARAYPGGPPLSNADIADVSGLRTFEVAAISAQLDWTGIDLHTMKLFLDACGLDLEDPSALKRVRVYLQGKKTKAGIRVPPRFTDLQRAPHWKSELEPLAILFFTYGDHRPKNGKTVRTAHQHQRQKSLPAKS